MMPQVEAELLLPAQPCSLCEVRGWVRQQAANAGCDKALAENLVLAVNEACMNVIQHAYCFACDQRMLLRARRERDALIFELLDHAQPVCAEAVKARALDDIRPGGLGVHFILSIMDEMAFVEPPAGFGNLLRMVKRIGVPGSDQQDGECGNCSQNASE
jgi:anti-sigma regulatory factor (Ser/Thr protein kinase)